MQHVRDVPMSTVTASPLQARTAATKCRDSVATSWQVQGQVAQVPAVTPARLGTFLRVFRRFDMPLSTTDGPTELCLVQVVRTIPAKLLALYVRPLCGRGHSSLLCI